MIDVQPYIDKLEALKVWLQNDIFMAEYNMTMFDRKMFFLNECGVMIDFKYLIRPTFDEWYTTKNKN